VRGFFLAAADDARRLSSYRQSDNTLKPIVGPKRNRRAGSLFAFEGMMMRSARPIWIAVYGHQPEVA
jgi:hypothetical protein